MQRIGLNVLTHSRITSYRTCQWRHYLEYEQGIRPVVPHAAYRFGGAFAVGLEIQAMDGLEAACNAVRHRYSEIPRWADTLDWTCECEAVLRLLAAYFWMWESDQTETIATELAFAFKVRNPKTGQPARVFKEHHGKVDKIVRLPDVRLAVRETKTAGEDILPDSDYWKRLKRDSQITTYVIGARDAAIDVQTVQYDVARKPTIHPLRATPVEKRRIKKNGEPYADVRMSDETPTEYGDRITADIGVRPNFYFARQEIPRMANDLDRYKREIWRYQQQMLDSRRSGVWCRNTSACLKPYKCIYHDEICDLDIDENTVLPDGWQRVNNIHQELAK